MSSVIDTITGHSTILLGVVAIVEGLLAAWLLRRNEEIRMSLRRARDAADQAARAAALTAPGGVDPEIVIQLLRSGQAVTLEVVHQMMEEREGAEAAGGA